MAPQPARLIDAGADEQPVEPGVEAVRVAQRGQVTPGSDERLLDGVLGLVGVPEDEPGGGIQAGDRGACQLGEGVMIAPSALAPRGLAASRPSAVARPTWPRSASMARRPSAVRSEFGRRPAVRRGTIALPATDPPEEPCPPVKIQEADAKSLLVAQGLPVPAWEVAHTVAEARAAAERFLADGAAGKVVIKAQVLVGGRGKAGGVKLAGSRGRGRARSPARSSAWTSRASRSARCSSAPAADIVKEFYLVGRPRPGRRGGSC